LLSLSPTCSSRECSERFRYPAKQELRQQAETLKVLLREVNHRVKNNLTAIIGMLQIEQSLVATARSETMLCDLIGRIEGLATVHSLLSATGWRPLELCRLCEQVIDAALTSVPRGRHVQVSVHCATPSSVRINSSQAHHLTLVINELATNTIKHALNDRDEVRIEVEIKLIDSSCRLIYRDDGPGYPASIVRGDTSGASVGFILIRGIVNESLRGLVGLSNDGGAVTTIQFKHQATSHGEEH
jgi:two-component sensor histidine kinase